DPESLIQRLNRSNQEQARAIRQQISSEYKPIDWHRDFKSGYRWQENQWYKKIRYMKPDLSASISPGVDVKVPWELSRMQHLPLFVYAYSLAKKERYGFYPSKRYLQIFQDQILDFIAQNPPRYGVNWTCTMDVAIRVSNWLFSYDLFLSQGAKFSKGFEKIFYQSIEAHTAFIYQNLEWYEELRANHYLADIAGLLVASAYLPTHKQNDHLLPFSIQELLEESQSQFYPEGSNFEASSSYHRLSSEMILYPALLLLNLPEEKKSALQNYQPKNHTIRPPIKNSSTPFYPIPGQKENTSPLPSWFFERLERTAQFSQHITKSNGLVHQVGDNDNGR
ncbi:heparinase II/III family protein, partial [Magnetococcales bacterium HHB-1]